MGVKIGGESQQFSEYLNVTSAGERPLNEVAGRVEGEGAATDAQSLSADQRFRVPARVTVQARPGEDPKELHRRILRQAASLAGLDGAAEQGEFVRTFEQGWHVLTSFPVTR